MYEFVVVVFMRYLMAVREGVTTKRCLDSPSIRVDAPEIYAPSIPGAIPLVSSSTCPTGVLVTMPASMIDAIFAFGVFELVAGSSFDAARGLLSL